MPTEILRPNAGGTTTQLWQWDGASRGPNPNENFTQVDEVIADNGATLVYEGAANPKFDTYHIPNSQVNEGVINHVTASIRIQCDTGDGQAKAIARTYATEYYGSIETCAVPWGLKSKQWPLNPHTLAPWTWPEINALEIGIHLLKTGAGSARCTQVYVEVDYTPSPPVTHLLHVRHPALLTVVQKRQGTIIIEYQTLSSLDDQYLTKQVGLDVLKGDIIEATTIAGILYKHQV